jgi:hypothetical protein
MGSPTIRTPAIADDPDSDFMNDSRILEGITLAELISGEESLEGERIGKADEDAGPRAQTPVRWKAISHG